ncbi:MAG TPA: NAD(P)-dependent oxidoreductase [Gammaproteobacteria bacterium]|nr:NAD(P)-dependent oxidoreductase [Gammaproteobacteria bacterium]
MAQIAFLGLGRMGVGMAGRLLAAGHALVVYNRTPARAEPLVRNGARLARTPREACEGADAVVAMTADDASSRATWLGDDGALAGTIAPRALAIECSTVSHAWALELGQAAAQRGLRYLDAPVTGLPPAAAAGELTLLVGAEAADLEAARPLLEALATRILHFGAVGAGTAYKLVINLIGAVQIAAAAEGLALAERAGLDTKAVVDAIATSQAASPQVVRNTRRMLAGDFTHDVTFTPVLRLKDVEYALRLADDVGVGTPFGRVARDAFRRLIELGGAAQNESRIIEVARGQPPPKSRL